MSYNIQYKFNRDTIEVSIKKFFKIGILFAFEYIISIRSRTNNFKALFVLNHITPKSIKNYYFNP